MLNENIKKYRKLQGLTQKQLADEVGISGAFMSLIEKGVNKPSPENLKKIAKALDVSVETLETEDNQSPLNELLDLLNKATKSERIHWELENSDLTYDGIYIFRTTIKTANYTFVYIGGDSTPIDPPVNGTCIIIDNSPPIYVNENDYKKDYEAFEELFNTIMIYQHDQSKLYQSINDLKDLLDD
jgi:transcriptional regulator|nr:MAG TPA: helix-turn-helix domain protein [Caudoviricetes sp.]